MADCKDCPLNGCVQVPWQVVDNPQWPILIIGRNPGGTEALTKVPFTGDAGKMCFRLLMEAGLDKRNLNITNLVSCPTEDDRPPTQKEIDCCHERMKAEIHFLKPELIVTMGQEATTALTGKDDKIGRLRGTFYATDPKWDYNCLVLAVYHPSFVMRQRQFIPEAVKDLGKIVLFFTTGIEVQERPKFYHEPSVSFLENYLSEEKGITTFDLETTGLNPRQDKILGISFCNTRKDAVACYLPEGDPRWGFVKDYLEDKNKQKCTQNGLYDLSMLNHVDIHVEGLTFDTHLGQKMLNSDLPADLQFLRQQYTDIEPYKPSDKEMKKMEYMSKKKLLDTGCWDAFTTYEVMLKEKENLSKEEMNLITNLLLPLVPCLNYMEEKGLLVDVDTLAARYAEMYPLKEELIKEFDPIGINPGSPVQICRHFGLKDSEAGTLEYYIKRDDPNSFWYKKILEYRKYEKSMGTYLKGVYNRLEEGRIHTKFKYGTGTLRLSSEDPNLQNVPEPLRIIYLPDKPEYFLAELDYKQLELRVVALVAKVQSLLDDLAKGIDPHEELRKKIYANGREVLTPPERQRLITKAAVFGTLYDRTPRSLAIEFGVTDMEARSWQEFCIYKYPEIKDYRKEMDDQLRNYGYVTTPFGNRRYITDKRQGYNTPIQSTASLVNLTSLLKLWKKRFDLRITVHDCNIPQVVNIDEAMEAKKVMEEPFEIFDGYSFPVKLKAGKNWYEVKEVK